MTAPTAAPAWTPADILDEAPAIEARVLELHRAGETPFEIGQALGLTAQRVAQILARRRAVTRAVLRDTQQAMEAAATRGLRP